MKLIEGIVCPPTVEHVGMFKSDLPSGGAMYNVWGRMVTQQVITGPMALDRKVALSMWNGMFSSTES